VLGSGGMRSKVVAAEMATAAGIPTVIANGQREGTIDAATRGEQIGTIFSARPDRVSSFKLWLKYAKPARGHVEVDAGAAKALREGGTSLLPVGVVGVRGNFEVGDAIEVTWGDEQVGKGISNYSSEELLRVRGLKSAEVRAMLPLASDEAVHRDYFVLA
jgi:glutamate 5-kinase